MRWPCLLSYKILPECWNFERASCRTQIQHEIVDSILQLYLMDMQAVAAAELLYQV